MSVDLSWWGGGMVCEKTEGVGGCRARSRGLGEHDIPQIKVLQWVNTKLVPWIAPKKPTLRPWHSSR